MKSLPSLIFLCVICAFVRPAERTVGTIKVVERDGSQYMQSDGGADETIYLMLMERYEGKETVDQYLEKKKQRKL